MSENPTQKQMDYRESLIRKRLNGSSLSGGALIEAIIIANLPEPTSKQEASEQIDALKNHTIKDYCKAHSDWYADLAARVEEKGEEFFKAAVQKRWDTLTPTDYLIEAFTL